MKNDALNNFAKVTFNWIYILLRTKNPQLETRDVRTETIDETHKLYVQINKNEYLILYNFSEDREHIEMEYLNEKENYSEPLGLTYINLDNSTPFNLAKSLIKKMKKITHQKNIKATDKGEIK